MDNDNSPGLAGALASLILLGAVTLILWVSGAFSSASANITCKQQQGTQYLLCIAGQARPAYVPYSTWRSARVGGYYDTGTRKVFTRPEDDPHAPHGLFGGGEGEHDPVHFSDGK